MDLSLFCIVIRAIAAVLQQKWNMRLGCLLRSSNGNPNAILYGVNLALYLT